MRRCLASLALLAACGDDVAPTGLRPLVPDPDVETGCVPQVEGRARVKVVECAEELVPGALAAGRVGDFVLENGHVRVIVRGPGAGYYLHGTSGGGIVDAVRKTPEGMSEDLVKEILPAIDLAVGAFDELVITEAGNDRPAPRGGGGRVAGPGGRGGEGRADSTWSLGFEETKPGVWKVNRITPVSLPYGSPTNPAALTGTPRAGHPPGGPEPGVGRAFRRMDRKSLARQREGGRMGP